MTNGDALKPKIFIDGEAGTTGLQIRDRLASLAQADILSIDPAQRKNKSARQQLMAKADLIVLCLPDAAAIEAVALARDLGDKAPKIVDASTAHRVAADWTYGFAELTAQHETNIKSAHQVANPGCYPTGAIALIRPLIDAGMLAADHPISINAVTGYSGGGRQMIEAYDAGNEPAFQLYGLSLDHKHIPELQLYSGLTRRPLFVPSIGDFKQGMVISIPLHLDQLPGSPSAADLLAQLQLYYNNARQVRVVSADHSGANLAATDLTGSDELELHVYGNDTAGHAVLVARLDNLGKGAAGAAVQNIQLMLGLS